MATQLSLFGPPEEISEAHVKQKKELDTLQEAPVGHKKWPRNLGMTYVGSKSRLLRGFWHLLPAADVFVDLFAGGCSITHAAMLDPRWKMIVSNDLACTPEAFLFAIRGGARNLADRWISRHDFKMLLERSDPSSTLLRLAFSFSCDGVTYRYGKATEPWKKLMHAAVLARTPRERQLALRRLVATNFRRLELPNLGFFNRCKELEKISGLAHKLQPSAMDYRELEIPADSIIYADPPYRGKQKYHNIGEFDSDSFWRWASACERPVFISEYEAPPDFTCIWSKMYRPKQAANGHAAMVKECLFANSAALDALNSTK